MFTWKRVALGCFVTPILLIAGCCGKMYVDWKLYELPGEVLRSSAKPTVELASALRVAQELDDYVQPRFEILRDKNFGAFRIVYKKHAGVVQLKVDTDREKEQIANVNAANRDYAICLLHCAPKPEYGTEKVDPHVELLYFNRKQVATADEFGGPIWADKDVAKECGVDWDYVDEQTKKALPQLMRGQEHKAEDKSWQLLMRPVLASKQECLSCHTNAKPGATLGVMVYAVRKTQIGETSKLASR